MYKSERLKVFSSNLPFLVSVNIGISTILVASGIYDKVNTNKIIWLLTIYAISCIRLLVHYCINEENPRKLDYHFWGVVLAGIGWACYPYLFQQTFSIKEEMICLIIFCGMSGGSITLLSADLRSALAFTLITVIPYCYVMITRGGGDERSIGIMGLGYAIALCLSATRSSKFIITSIASQAKVKRLVINLESEVEKRTKRILKLEQKDMLTGLFNRNSFFSKVDILRQEKNNKSESIDSFIHIDIEKFHIINNTYGHEYGDYMLNEIGQRLSKIDTFFNSVSSRWGSDEFIIYISCHSEQAINDFINQVIGNLSRSIQSKNIRVTPSYHIGYYYCTDNYYPIDKAIKNSYLAVSEGKRSNQHICCFDQKIQASNERKSYLRRAMVEALEMQDFFMNYQPIVDSELDKVHSFEALIRWNLNGELVSPEEFISIAEEHGLIIDIGKLVLKMAIETLHDINVDNPRVSMSINVSAIQFEDENFIEYLQFLIAQYAVQPGNIHLEITETAMITNLDKLTRIIKQVKEIGVMISVDDFGTGFSSILVLKNLRIDYIKVDKSYVDNICRNEKDHSIVSAVVKMAHSIDSKVIVEGVEYPDQLALLKESNIDLYQGYLFSKPVKKDQVLALLKQHNH